MGKASSTTLAPSDLRRPNSVTYRCEKCQRTTRAELSRLNQQIDCEYCGSAVTIIDETLRDERLVRCPICGCDDLFVRKDFPQRLGVSIVVIGFAISCITWYFHWLIATFAVLMATALIDVILYAIMGDVLECYRCHSQYRGGDQLEGYGAFELEKHEKHRQMKARQTRS